MSFNQGFIKNFFQLWGVSTCLGSYKFRGTTDAESVDGRERGGVSHKDKVYLYGCCKLQSGLRVRVPEEKDLVQPKAARKQTTVAMRFYTLITCTPPTQH